MGRVASRAGFGFGVSSARVLSHKPASGELLDGSGLGFRVYGAQIECVEFRVQGSGFKVQGHLAICCNFCVSLFFLSIFVWRLVFFCIFFLFLVACLFLSLFFVLVVCGFFSGFWVVCFAWFLFCERTSLLLLCLVVLLLRQLDGFVFCFKSYYLVHGWLCLLCSCHVTHHCTRDIMPCCGLVLA